MKCSPILLAVLAVFKLLENTANLVVLLRDSLMLVSKISKSYNFATSLLAITALVMLSLSANSLAAIAVLVCSNVLKLCF